ncbi:B12-binding domain-containing radical SAM protein [Thermodesulfobacteriota bacterium]
MRIILINAPVKRRSPHSMLSPPLGLAYIASALIASGQLVRAYDFNIIGMKPEMIRRMATVDAPDIVGISAHTETITSAFQIADLLKLANPDIRVVMGGPHPSILPVEVLSKDSVDYVVLGEGEKPMIELVRYLEDGKNGPASIKGLAYKNNGIKINERDRLVSPDELNYPARDLFPMQFYKDKWNVLTARGSCPYKCPFCSASAIWGGRRMARTADNVVGEIRMLVERYEAGYVFFTDDIFTINRQWVNELLERLKAMNNPPAWGCATRVDLVDEHLLLQMSHAGCRSIQFGIESGSREILDSVKGITKRQALKAVYTAVKAGIRVASSFMVPFPEDTVETLKETMSFMKELKSVGSNILVSYTTPYPGTRFYEESESIGIKILTNDWSEFDAKHNIIQTRHLDEKQIDDMVRKIEVGVGLKRRI